MSLYGSGRREGIVATVVVAALALLAHLGTAMAHGVPPIEVAPTALCAALGGVTLFRYLRAQGRSRYAAFVCAAASATSPLFPLLAAAPREQLAAALAPLALEAARRSRNPAQQRAWLPWAGLLLATPLVAGDTVIGVAAATLASLAVLRAAVDVGEYIGSPRSAFTALLLGGVAAGNLLLLDPLGGLIGTAAAPRAPAELATALGAFGPFAIWLTLLGLLRRQRQERALPWLLCAAVGALPLFLLPLLPAATGWLALFGADTAAWLWLGHLALAALGAAGLDDFLELPMRRRHALALMTAATLLLAPLACGFANVELRSWWPLLSTFATLALVVPAWRRLGVLGVKNWLAVASLATFGLLLWHSGGTFAPHSGLPAGMHAAPLGEIAAPTTWSQHLPDVPWWHYSGLIAVALVALPWALWPRRSQTAKATPRAAKAAIHHHATGPARR